MAESRAPPPPLDIRACRHVRSRRSAAGAKRDGQAGRPRDSRLLQRSAPRTVHRRRCSARGPVGPWRRVTSPPPAFAPFLVGRDARRPARRSGMTGALPTLVGTTCRSTASARSTADIWLSGGRGGGSVALALGHPAAARARGPAYASSMVLPDARAMPTRRLP